MKENDLISEKFEKYLETLNITDAEKDELAEKLLTAAYFRAINILTGSLPDGHTYNIFMLDNPEETMVFLKKHYKYEVVAETVKKSFREIFEKFLSKKLSR